MTMLKLALGSLVTLCLFTTSFGQYNTPQSSVWAVGNKKGLDFSTNPPTLIETGLSSANEGSASIADENGQLLFCTNGTNVWGSDGIALPNGTNINGTGLNTTSTTQAAVIIPFPSNPGKYFLFSMTPVSNCRLYSNIVDMQLNNGLGAIDTTYSFHKVLLKNGLTEKMTAAKGCNNDAWLLVHSNTSVSFLAYHITANGLDTVPVISHVGNMLPTSYNQGVMKVSPDGIKIMTNTFAANGNNLGTEVYDFDPSTGIVSNAQLVDNINAYGGTFSPKGTKLYVQEITATGKVWQYDLTNIGQESAKTFIGNSGQYCDMKLAPDGKIYVASPIQSMGFNSYRYFARINSPEELGSNCNFQDTVSGLAFPSGNNGSLTQGLPNDVIIPTPAPTIQALVLDSIVCTNEPLSIVISLPTDATNFSWSDNYTGATRVLTQAGTYIANYQSTCSFNVDTFKVSQAALNAPTIIQAADELTLDNQYDLVNWYMDGTLISTEPSIQIATAGVYSVVVKNAEGCEANGLNTIQSSLAIESIDKTAVSIFPNPTNGTTTLQVHAGNAKNITIMDNLGKLVAQYEMQHDKQMIDLTAVSNGTYILEISWIDGTTIQRKIVKL